MSALKLKTAEEVNAILAVHEARDETLLERELASYKREEIGMWLWLVLFFLLSVAAVGCSKPKPVLTALPDVHDPALHIVAEGNRVLKLPDGESHVGDCLKGDDKGNTFWMPCDEPLAISQLRYEVHKRGFHFVILCYESDDEKFLADAMNQKTWAAFEKGGHIEDGAEPYWDATGPTQEIAAKKLLTAMNGAPNMIPTHRPKEKDCPPEISGN